VEIFYYAIFPGFLFIMVVGFFASWVDRKVTARIHYRIGPPFFQSFIDVFKLLGKEILIPRGTSKFLFILSPVIVFSSAILAGANVLFALFGIRSNYLGSDIYSIMYLLTIPSLFIIMGAMASRNPLASVGAAREAKLILAYELPFILCIIAIIVKINDYGTGIKLNEIVTAQYSKPFIASASGVIAAIILLFCIHAKMTIPPFDIPEAETEIMEGTFIEYSGFLLAMFQITKMMLLFVLPAFLILLVWGDTVGNDISILWFALKYIGILVIMILIKNTNPRVKIDQAVRFFWFYLSIPAVASIILASYGY